jgi:hypothetical protein
VIKWYLVLVTLNHFGHPVYHSRTYASHSECAAHLKPGASCIEADTREYFSENHLDKNSANPNAMALLRARRQEDDKASGHDILTARR